MIDNGTSKRIYNHFSIMLVDMDFSKKLFYEILVEREVFSFPVEVVYEWLPNFCSHCQNLGHDVTGCRWLYPRKKSQVPHETVVKGKAQFQSKNQAWVPLKYNPSVFGSSTTFVASAEKHSNVAPSKDMTANSFSFALQNVTDEIPQGVLPHSDMHVLELVTVKAHDDVHLCEGEGTIAVTTDARVTQVPVVSTTLSHSKENVDMHEVVNVDSSTLITDESVVPIHTITDMTIASVDQPQSFNTALDDDVSDMVQ